MSRLRYFVPAAVSMGLFLVCATATFAKKEYTAKEKKACVYCHTGPKTKELNDTGRCYDKDKSLANCKAPAKK